MSESMNAAQIASRKIKSAKGVRGKLGNRVTSNTGVPGLNGTQPFHGQDASTGGNLFGGGLNAAGTFNFSAPVQGISFGNKSETPATTWGLDGGADEDRRPDTLTEEAERRNKPFRMLESSITASPQPFSTTFQRTPLSALGQPNGISSAPDAAKPNPFQVSRSQSPAVANPFNFGNSAPQAQQATSNIFSFGQSTQPPAVNSIFRFGTPPAVPDKPAANSFSFNQASSQGGPVSTSSSFGSTTTTSTTQPAISMFSFGQTSAHAQQPSTPAMDFNNPPATVNIFGNSNTSTSLSTPFGQSKPQPSSLSNNSSNFNSMTNPTSDIFGNQSQQSMASSTSIFGDQTAKPAGANALFGGLNQQNTPTLNGFGNTNQASQSASSLFGTFKEQSSQSASIFSPQKEEQAATHTQSGAPKEQPTPSSTFFGARKDSPAHASHLFSAQNDQATSAGSIFGGETKQPPSANSLFSIQQPKNTSTSSLFGGSRASETLIGREPKSSANIFSSTPSKSTSGIFTNQAVHLDTSKNPFAKLNKSAVNIGEEPANPEVGAAVNESEVESVLPSIEVDAPIVDSAILTRLESETSAQRNGSNLFSSVKPSEIPKFSLATTTSANSNITNESASPEKPSSGETSDPVNGTSAVVGKDLGSLQDYSNEMGEIPDAIIDEKCPKHFTDAQRIQFFTAYRIRSLNKGIKQYIQRKELGTDFSPTFHHYIERREEILEAGETGLNNLKRKHEEVEGEADSQQSSPKKRSKPSELASAIQHVPRKSSPLKTQPVVNNFQRDRRTSPEKQPLHEARRPSMSPTKRAQQSFVGSTTPKALPPARSLFPTQQDSAPVSSSPKGKRKAEVQIDKDHPTEEEAIGASHSSKWHPSNESKPSSATSGVFKSILDSPSQQPSGSPEKRMFSSSKTQSVDKPRSNPFAALPMPASSQLAASPNGVNLFSTKPASSNSLGASSMTPGENQTSSNLFAPRPGAQTSSLFKTASTTSAESTNPISNPFAPKEGSTTSGVFSAKPASSTPSMSTVAPSANLNMFNPFVPKSASTATTSGSSSDADAKIVKPPTFGSTPINFLAQFGQKSKKSMADAEAEALEKAKEEDMDSDEDEAEWEAKYKEKRAAEKKATEELAKNKHATFIPGKGFTFDKAQHTADNGKSAAKSIFTQTSVPVSFSSNLFAPINRSEASSPVAASSRASSVFDGLGPPKAVTFGGHNIFGHLSDVDSGADSGRGNDADDDITDGETSNSNDEQDDENKDTTYDPSVEDGPGPESPSTPVEGTGPGITSAKKPTAIFNFNSSNSGTSTPASGGSLFDRISKDPNGNPIRQMPTENKENSGTGTTSIFGGNAGKPFAGFGEKASADGPKSTQDNTWKPDSPIRFGSSTTSPPAVNVTAPTPTKPTSFTGLFGSNAPPTPTGSPFGVFGTSASAKPSSPASFAGIFGNNASAKPMSGLFAHLSDSKPAPVGFGFGSTAGSLLPSTTGSTATSRATSPGGTTDGESNNENIDPEAEHHAQIDLTTGGPGEENEEVLHQVRAKALKFEASKDTGGKTDWVVKGLGPLRVLKNKETGTSRVLLRADPSGTIILNKGILENVTYAATGKTLKLLTAGDGGQGLETWLLQVKTPAGAEELATVLEDNRQKV